MLFKLMKIPLLKNLYILFTRVCSILPDSVYLRITYLIRMKKRLHLKNPQGFNEKLQWLKIHDPQRSQYTTMVDKFKARDYITKKIGSQYLIPLLGIYNSVEEINVADLPEQFVVKCTHDSGSVVICRSKKEFDEHKRKQLQRALKRKFYYASREYALKYAEPKIIIERYMSNGNEGLFDYKFYCFHGEPKYLYVSGGLVDHSTARISFYNIDLSDAPFQRGDYLHFDKIPYVPPKYDEMLEVARKLSEGIPFVRVDLYEIEGQVYFSELTFYPCNGMMPFQPEEWDEILGREIDITSI